MADVLSALQQLIVKQGTGSKGRGYGRGYNSYPRPPYPLPKPRDPVPPPQPGMAVEVDQDDLVGAWSLEPPEEEFQVLHIAPGVDQLTYPSWPAEPVEVLTYPQWSGDHSVESVDELTYPQWSETGVSTDPGPDPDHNFTMHKFAGKLLGHMQGKARDSQLVMKAQGTS